MPVGMFEAEAPFAEVDALRAMPAVTIHCRGAVDGGAADALVFALDDVDEVVGTEVPFLPQEHVLTI